MKVAQTTQDLFRTTAEEWFMQARHVAEKLCQERGTITIKDVLEVHPLPEYLNYKKNSLGGLFMNSVFKKVGGPVRSSTTASHGHYIHRWQLREEMYPASMLTYTRRDMEEYGRDN